MYVQGVFLSTTSSMDMQGVPPFYHQQYGRAGCTPFHHLQYGRAGYTCPSPAVLNCRVCTSPQPTMLMCRVFMLCNHIHLCKVVCKFRNAGLSGIRSVQYQTEHTCWYRNQSGSGIRGPSTVPGCSSTGLSYRMLEYQCTGMTSWPQISPQLKPRLWAEILNVHVNVSTRFYLIKVENQITDTVRLNFFLTFSILMLTTNPF